MPLKVLFDAKVFALAARTGNRSGVYRYASALSAHLTEERDIECRPVCPDLMDYPWVRRELQTIQSGRLGAIRTWREFLPQDVHATRKAAGRLDQFRRQWLARIKRGTRQLPLLKRLGRQHLVQQGGKRDHVIFHSPFHLMPEAAAGMDHFSLVRTIHDLLPLSMPQYFIPDSVKQFELAISSIGSQEHIICVSETVRSQVERFVPSVNVDRLHAFPLAADAAVDYAGNEDDWDYFRAVFGFAKHEQILLSVGTIEPRKNHCNLIRGFERALRDLPDLPLRLVIAGGLGWNYQPVLEQISNSRVSAQILLLGAIPDALLTCLYQRSLATVFVSWGEGFGLPLLESMRNGTPVIASSVPALVEVAGNAACFVDPGSDLEISQAIKAVTTSSQVRTKLATLGFERAQLFSWRKTASSTARLYRQIHAR